MFRDQADLVIAPDREVRKRSSLLELARPQVLVRVRLERIRRPSWDEACHSPGCRPRRATAGSRSPQPACITFRIRSDDVAGGVSRGHARLPSRGGSQSLAAAEQVRTAEVIASLSLATDLGIVVPLEHGLQSTLLAMRLAMGWGSTRKPPRRPTMRVSSSTSAVPPMPMSLQRSSAATSHSPRMACPQGSGRGRRWSGGSCGQSPHPAPGPGARRGARARPPEAGEALQSPDRCSMRGGSDADRPPRPPLNGGGTLQLRLGAVGPFHPTAPRRS